MSLILLKTIALAGGVGNPFVELPAPPVPLLGEVEVVGADGAEELFPAESPALVLPVLAGMLVPAAEAGEPATVFAGPALPQPASNMVTNKPEKETSVENIGWAIAPPETRLVWSNGRGLAA
jgi:hypothetical protein